MKKDLELSLLQLQRTYLQSQQPPLNKHLFQSLVHKCDFETV
jgi:hypothetical protein